MKKKRGLLPLLILFTIILLTGLALAAYDETAMLDNGYKCLEDKLGDNCADTSNTAQAAFSLLAMSDKSSIKSDCKSSLQDIESNDCWGETKLSACNLKSTSLAILALNHIGTNTDDNVDWLLSHKKPETELMWFLEVDANNATTCTIEADNSDSETFEIGENKKISGSSSCLIPAEQDYFLRIANSCLEKNFTISCNKNFITTLLYKTQGGETYHVSSITHSAPAGDSTEEKVESYCFGISSGCDYEGSLWAALALAKTGEDITPYLPYITAFSDKTENKKYLPSSFLYMLTNDDEFYIELIALQKSSQYWQESGNKLFDTALALLSLHNLALTEVQNTKEYLSEIQDSEGCWGTVSDTAFLLYAINPSSSSGGDGGGSGLSECEDSSFGYFCVSPSSCSLSDVLKNFYCPSLGDVCCEKSPESLTCSEKNGIICQSTQECTQTEVPAYDTDSCCLGSCIATSAKTECEEFSYACQTECDSNQIEKTNYDCYTGEVCCAEKTSSGLSWLWIILLIILIIIVVLLIIFRNRVKLWWYQRKNKTQIGKPPRPSQRPMPPFRGPAPPPFQRPLLRRVAPRRPSPRDREFDETMKKLRDMSK